MSVSIRRPATTRMSRTALAMLVIAVFLTACDAGQFWLDPCHYLMGARCSDSDSGLDLCENVPVVVPVVAVDIGVEPQAWSPSLDFVALFMPAPSGFAPPFSLSPPRAAPLFAGPVGLRAPPG